MAETARGAIIARLTAPGGGFDIEERVVNGVPWRVFGALPSTLREIVELSRGHGDRDFLVYDGDRWTFARHYEVVAGLAHRLLDHYGLRRGDRVAIAMRNYPEWVPIFWATQAAGLIAVPLNAWWTGSELEYALKDSGARLLFADGERVAAVRGLDGLDLVSVVEVRGAGGADVEPWPDVLAAIDAAPPETRTALPDVTVEPEDDATILYTSGTTGRPKGAIGSNRNHCTNTWNTVMNGVVGAMVNNGGQMPEPNPDAPPPGSLQTFPFFHIAGITGICGATAAGSKLVCMYKWDPVLGRKLIIEERLTGASGVPMVMRSLVEAMADDPGGVETLGSIALGGAPIPPDLIMKIDEQFASKVGSGDGYGLTETTSAVVVNAGEDYVSHPDSVGRCTPGADIRVVDPGTNDDVGAGEIGELWFRGPLVVRGYWNKPEATAQAFTDGWFHTGDLGYVRDGWVYVVDRIKDVVIRGGENVYCAEVEAALFEHPAVADVAVIGLPHPTLGEEVVAVVNVRPGHAVTAAELRDHTAGRIARFKAPTRVWFRDEPLPRTGTGKVLKRDLRQAAQAERIEAADA
jgi:acyl-CoA synthetase (AMP-forming)/AMP-acid ligase II